MPTGRLPPCRAARQRTATTSPPNTPPTTLADPLPLRHRLPLPRPRPPLPRRQAEDSDDEPADESSSGADYLAPFLPPGAGAGGLAREQCLAAREAALRALKDRLVERANIIQGRLDEEQVGAAGWDCSPDSAALCMCVGGEVVSLHTCAGAREPPRAGPTPAPLPPSCPRGRGRAAQAALQRRRAALARDHDVLSPLEEDEAARAAEEAGFKISILQVGEGAPGAAWGRRGGGGGGEGGPGAGRLRWGPCALWVVN